MKKYTIYRIYGVKDENSPKRKKELAAVLHGVIGTFSKPW
jgi:hypothetical protein